MSARCRPIPWSIPAPWAAARTGPRATASSSPRRSTSARGRRPRSTSCCATDLGEVALPLGLLLEVGAFLGEDLGDALGREAHVDEARPDIGDLAVVDDLAVAQIHHGDTLEADALSVGLRQ